MAACARHVQTKQFINAVLALCGAQDEVHVFDNKTRKKIMKLEYVIPGLATTVT